MVLEKCRYTFNLFYLALSFLTFSPGKLGQKPDFCLRVKDLTRGLQLGTWLCEMLSQVMPLYRLEIRGLFWFITTVCIASLLSYAVSVLI